jgi:hypothetical protein
MIYRANRTDLGSTDDCEAAGFNEPVGDNADEVVPARKVGGRDRRALSSCILLRVHQLSYPSPEGVEKRDADGRCLRQPIGKR